MTGETLSLSSGTLVIAGINQEFDAAINFGSQRAAKVDVHFTSLGPDESAAIAALLAGRPGVRLDPERPAKPQGLVFRKPPALHVRF